MQAITAGLSVTALIVLHPERVGVKRGRDFMASGLLGIAIFVTIF